MPLFRAHLTESMLLTACLCSVGACEEALSAHRLEESESNHHAAFVAERDGGDRCAASVMSLLDAGAAAERNGGSCRSATGPDQVETVSDAGVPFEPEGLDGPAPKFSAAGTGCRDAGARLTWAADKRSLHVELDHLRAEITAESPWRSAMSFCDLVLPVVSGRQTFAIKAITTTSLTDLPDAVKAGLLFMPSSVGSGPRSEHSDSRRLPVPMHGRTVVRSDFSDKLDFLPCGHAVQLILTARVNVQDQSETDLKPASLAIERMDIELAMRECTTD